MTNTPFGSHHLLTIGILILIITISISAQTRNVPEFGPWSAPINIGPVINSDKDDAAPVISNNGRTLFFTSNRVGSIDGSEDLWVSTRKNKNAEWSEPVPLTMLNTNKLERLRSISPDGRILVFQSDRPNGLGGSDIWAAVRANKNDELGWSEPVNLGSVINTGSNEIAGNYVFGNSGRSQKFYVSSARTDLGGLGDGDIYVSEIPAGGKFEQPVNVTELNSAWVETCFWVRDDDLEIIFSSTRGEARTNSSAFDLWTSTRLSGSDKWSDPVPLGSDVNAVGYQDVNPFVSPDGTTMYFSSRRPNSHGPAGTMDIYVSTRERLR